MSWEGQQAPDFRLPDQDGNEHSLADYRGQTVLLYFYPRDNTPGCTVEAQQFRDRLEELQAHGVQVLGVSRDTVKSHRKFADKESLNFPILADPEHEVLKAYNLLKEKTMFGKPALGVNRESFLIDEQGVIRRHYAKVKPEAHVDEILQDLEATTSS
ncbi:thioredoxin-dependent thiol peroxidase [Halospina sp. K52047b]|uniref:thioredoxin-dependent thiol peroxidase n=1 Tax=Halospina sp. K52047b TaxID=2614160 RepID=UPI00124AC746|nr:thioredoxin-dependent thiol peroxidase [Halospina sp. K52047b]KAA8979717.1 thioredoxin-dependent thiol peroxidase [Halospina sp. K52047b]